MNNFAIRVITRVMNTLHVVTHENSLADMGA